MHAAACALLLMALSAAAPQDPPKPVKATLQELAWLAGNWTGTLGRAAIEERWTARGRQPAGERAQSFVFTRQDAAR